MRGLTPLEVQGLVMTLREVGIPIVVDSSRVSAIRSLTRREAADLLGVSVSWIRAHEDKFPNRWRAGEDVRIPLADLESYIVSQRIEANT